MTTDEQKRILLLAGIGLLVVCVVQFVVMPVLDFKDESLKQLRRQEQRYDRLQQYAWNYASLVAARKNQAKKFDTGKGALLGTVNKEVKQLNLAKNLASMKPGSNKLQNGFKEETVTLRFDRMYLEDVVKFLHRMEEQNDGILVKAVSLARKKGSFLSVDIILAMTMPE
ncbi:MAG: type II secretion system protein GspM [Desulfovibrio sp.]